MEYLHPKPISKDDEDEYKQMRIRIEIYKKRYARKEPIESRPVEPLNELFRLVMYESTKQVHFESICALERDSSSEEDGCDILLVVIAE